MLAAVLAGLFLGGFIATRLLPEEAEVPVAIPAMAFAIGAILHVLCRDLCSRLIDLAVRRSEFGVIADEHPG